LVTLVFYGFHQRFVVPAATAVRGSHVCRTLDRTRLAMTGLGAVLVLVGLIGLFWPQATAFLGPFLPLALVAAAILLAYGEHLRPRRAGGASGVPVRVVALLVTLGLLGTIWAIALYAQQLGREAALTSEASLSSDPEVVLYSTERLAIAGSGVQSDSLTMDGSRFRFRYSGLRLLTRTAGKYVLLPAGWQPGRDSVFFIADNDSIRADVFTNPAPGEVEVDSG
jgi:hypothetical protein